MLSRLFERGFISLVRSVFIQSITKGPSSISPSKASGDAGGDLGKGKGDISLYNSGDETDTSDNADTGEDILELGDDGGVDVSVSSPELYKDMSPLPLPRSPPASPEALDGEIEDGPLVMDWMNTDLTNEIKPLSNNRDNIMEDKEIAEPQDLTESKLGGIRSDDISILLYSNLTKMMKKSAQFWIVQIRENSSFANYVTNLIKRVPQRLKQCCTL
jgi:hypothetical protein